MTLTFLASIIGIAFLAALTQSATGFGSALVAMSLLPALIGIQTATPLVALLSLVGTIALWLYYRDFSDLRSVLQLAIASLIAIPIGTWCLDFIPEKIALRGLGVLLVSYVIYDSFQLKLPALKSSAWAYGFGFVSGILSGAYNTGGVIAAVYANCRRWNPQEFRSNLTSFLIINSVANVVSHTLHGNMTAEVLRLSLYSIPDFLVGLVVGTIWTKYLNPKAFRKIILGLLLITGIRLLNICINC